MLCIFCLDSIEENQFNCTRCSMISHLNCIYRWNRVLNRSRYFTYFKCPVCKISVDVSVYNPKSGRFVYKYSNLGKALTKRYNKLKNPMYILNHKTNKLVKRTSSLGKQLVKRQLINIHKV